MGWNHQPVKISLSVKQVAAMLLSSLAEKASGMLQVSRKACAHYFGVTQKQFGCFQK